MSAYEKAISAIQSTIFVKKSLFVCENEIQVIDVLQELTEQDYPCTDKIAEFDERYRMLIITADTLADMIDYIDMDDMTAIYTMLPPSATSYLEFISVIVQNNHIGLWCFL